MKLKKLLNYFILFTIILTFFIFSNVALSNVVVSPNGQVYIKRLGKTDKKVLSEDASSRVGIGTNSPVADSLLHIKGHDGAASYPRMLVIEDTETSTYGTPGISFKVNRTSYYNWDMVTNYGAIGNLEFRVGASALADPTSSTLTLTSNGNVEIKSGTLAVQATYGQVLMGPGTSAYQNVGLYRTYAASDSNNCAYHCSTNDATAGFSGSSGYCIYGWRSDSGAELGCADGSVVPKTCMCAGSF